MTGRVGRRGRWKSKHAPEVMDDMLHFHSGHCKESFVENATISTLAPKIPEE